MTELLPSAFIHCAQSSLPPSSPFHPLMNERNRGNATMAAAATANDQLSSLSESPACDNGGADGWAGRCVPIMLWPHSLARLMHIEDAGNTNCRFVYPSPHFHFPPALYEQRDSALPHCTARERIWGKATLKSHHFQRVLEFRLESTFGSHCARSCSFRKANEDLSGAYS